MKSHFNFTDEQMKNLYDKKISVKDLFRFAREFDPTGKLANISIVTLYYYVDKKGDFMCKPHFKTKEICREIFNNLDSEDKLLLLEYISDSEEGRFN